MEQVNHLHSLLEVFDQPMSQYLHKNDKRRIVNALFKFFRRSAILDQASEQKDILINESEISYTDSKIQLRFMPILVQIKASEPVICQRIRKRIYQMIFDDLGINEIVKVFNSFEEPLSFDKGVLQAIGYKEFYGLYQHLKSAGQTHGEFTLEDMKAWRAALDSGQIDERTEQLRKCIEGLYTATVRYSKYQSKWLRKRIAQNLGKPQAQSPALLYEICLDDKVEYERVARDKAFEHIEKLLKFYDSEL